MDTVRLALIGFGNVGQGLAQILRDRGQDLARRYAADRIAVNSIAPAMTETPLFGVVSAEVLEAAIAQMPHGRAMQPAEVAEWVRFLISPAGDICSGNVIRIGSVFQTFPFAQRVIVLSLSQSKISISYFYF